MQCISDEELRKCCADLDLKLSDKERNEKDVNGIELYDEIVTLKTLTSCNQNPKDVLEYITHKILIRCFRILQ